MMRRLTLILLLLPTIVFAQDIDVLHYRYELELQDKHDTITGYTTIQFVHRSDKKEVSFDLVGRKADGKGMRLLWVANQGEADAVRLDVKQEKESFFVILPETKKGDTTTLLVHYKGVPADGLIISKNKFGQRTFFADNWPNRA